MTDEINQHIRKFSSLSHTLLHCKSAVLPWGHENQDSKSWKQTHHPATLDKAADLTKGVLIQGFDISPSSLPFVPFVIGVVEPMLAYMYIVFVFVDVFLSFCFWWGGCVVWGWMWRWIRVDCEPESESVWWAKELSYHLRNQQCVYFTKQKHKCKHNDL